MYSNITGSYPNGSQPWAFWPLLSVVIPASIVSLFILIFFFSHWNLMIKKSIHHHPIFILIIISFVNIVFDLPVTLSYFRLGYDIHRAVPICLLWYWLHYSLLVMSLTVTATASVQRHILIFQSHLLHVKKARWIIHYLPLTISLIFPPLFYMGFMFIYQCELYYNPESAWCTYPCYIDDTMMFNIDWFVTTLTPVLTIFIANVTLIVRVVNSMKKIRRQQQATWRRQRKLTLQLLSFSSLYLITWFPTTILAVIRSFFILDLYTQMPNLYYTNYMSYFVCPLQTFLCLLALPEVIDFLKRQKQLFCRRATVGPIS